MIVLRRRFTDTDTCPWVWEPQRSQSLFNNIKSSSRWSRWNTLRLLVMRLKVRLGLKSVNGASLIFWNGSCPLFLRSCLLWCLRLRCYTKEKLCGKFSMCWYVSWNNVCFDMTGAETLILASFMCHPLEWKNDEIAFHVNSQKKSTCRVLSCSDRGPHFCDIVCADETHAFIVQSWNQHHNVSISDVRVACKCVCFWGSAARLCSIC